MITISTYDELLIEADSQGLTTKEKPLQAFDGLIYKDRIAIRESIKTRRKKACVLAEELGHYHTSFGDILDQEQAGNRKQEYRARMWAYNKQIGLTGIIRAYEHQCLNIHEIADFLNVTETFLIDTLEAYRLKYGVCTRLDNYVIYFEPHLYIADMNF